jgi:hypothetical protein
LISSLSLALIIFFFLSHKMYLRLTSLLNFWKNRSFELANTLAITRTQLRIITKVKEVLKDTTKQPKKL